jgi:hypothetical protein
MEFFYDKLQYFASQRPGRRERHTQYRSGWVTPAERVYGDAYQALPAKRAEAARKRGIEVR